jgi:4-amino-4-deoxy-L-arabinose transferase-like glycosyltransferase
LSLIFDIGTLYLVLLISSDLFRRNSLASKFAVFFYALSVLPIQLSHFYAVDIPLTFFITLSLYLALRLINKPSTGVSIALGVSFGLTMATKITGVFLLIPIGVMFLILLVRDRDAISLLKFSFAFFLFAFLPFILFMPYAFIDFKTFLAQTLEQSRMSNDAFVFPYTLQYVGTTPYLYFLKNIFLWGMGPIVAFMAFAGILYVPAQLAVLFLKRIKTSGRLFVSGHDIFKPTALVLFVFLIVYFGVVGKSAVKFMRYMLPIYPILAVFGGSFAGSFFGGFVKRQLLYKLSVSFFLLSIFLWPVSFLAIYTRPNTRVSATKWINENIIPGSTLATEHWDDALPLFPNKGYKNVELTLYEPDTDEKWRTLNERLSGTDYIIIASNRLYTPLMKLTNCERLPRERCYKRTADYYRRLFGDELGFSKVAEFTSFPTFGPVKIDDQGADESFTVYDHPKVMIFRKATKG